ncbi:MAG: PDK repeat-containing protein [Methanobacterium sp. Maddingley MBC34]|nr:MAG: PDK repeat-containing protein [Methanobacterium sp. Maddingley MBC34]
MILKKGIENGKEVKRKTILVILSLFFVLILCGTVSADTPAINDSTNGSVNDTSNTATSHEVSGQDCLPTVANGTIHGEVYISSIADWPGSNPDTFTVPNGTVVFARYYTGVWMGTATTTFNGHDVPINGSYSSGMGVTWISYDVTSYVIPGGLNTASSSSSGSDGRQYGNTLVVVLQNETKPLIEYWITEGLDWLNYNPPSVDWSNTTIAGTVNQANVQNASLYSVHLTGYNYEDINGHTLPSPSEHVSGSYFDALRWDNIQGLLVAENQSINVGRGDDTYTSPVFHALTLTFKAADLVPTNLTPTLVVPNISNTLIATIKNQGDKDSTAFNVSLMVDGTAVDTQTVSSLALGSSTTVDFHWTPDGTKGSYNLTVFVDPENTIDESGEINNSLEVLVGTTTASAPVAEFTSNTTSGDEPLDVYFIDQSNNSPTSWLWDFGDGSNSTDQNPMHPYTIPGVYNVNLTVTNVGGSNSTRKNGYITVNAVTPVASFTTNTTSGAIPLTVQFNDTSSHVPTEWFWDFGDGTNSTDQNPLHTYNNAGTYTVKLTASNAVGNNTIEKSNLITSITTPVSNFTATTTIGNAPFTVTFTDQSTNTPTSWLWNFGDGTTSTSQNPTHTYSTLGTYYVMLTAANIAGNNTTTKTGYITTLTRIGPVWASKSEWYLYVGSGNPNRIANPALADLDGDGDYDLLIGLESGICYAYENTGTTSSPVWTAKTAWNTPDIGSGNNYAAPCFADLDGDGDYDLLIGASDGVTYGYENTGTASSPVWIPKSAWDTLDIGDRADPVLADLDGDGDNDLLIGAKNGVTYGYENTGTITNPVWTVKSTWDAPDDLGDLVSPVLADLDSDGDFDLIIAAYCNPGSSYAYENIGSANSPVWTRKAIWDPPIMSGLGWDAAPALADLDGDGDYDLLRGTFQPSRIYGYENTASHGNPDLTPTTVNLPSNINVGTPCVVSAVVSNNGTFNVGAFVATLSVDGVVVDTQSVLGPTAGSNSTVNFTWTPATTGDHNLLVTVDSVNGITESDETNNSLTQMVNVKVPAPVAEFEVNDTNVTTVDSAKFTDKSVNAPTSWKWEYNNGSGWTEFSTEQNPVYTFATVGTYDIRLTATNDGGNSSTEKLGCITVAYPYDLAVTGNVDVVPLNKNTVFAKETNPIKVTIINNGSGTANNILVALYASDVSGTVPVATATIDSLAAGASTTIEIIDPTIRNLEGGTVTYTVKVDPDNLILENNETNNAMDSTVKSVNYNGYKGKQYWETGSNVTTQRTYDIYGNMVYSNGDSSYHGGGWNDYTVTWSDIQPTIPSTASIVEAWLYVAYTWDETGLVPNNLTLTFNGHVLNYVNWYVDQANFGTYANYKYGLLTYNVTDFYNKNGVNTLFLDRNGNSSIAMYPCNLMVIYEDANSTRKQIFINEEADLLGFSPTSYGTTLDEATAYVPFTGMVIDTSKVKNATFYSSAGNAGPDEGNFIWNGSLIKSNAWNGTSTGIFTLIKDVTSYLTSTGNVAGIQGTNSGGMAALQQILVVEYAPDLVVTNITVNKGSGDNWFANEPNILTINVTNQGGSAAPESTLNIDVNGTTYTVNIPELDAGSNTTVTVTDPTSRTSGDNMPVSATTDPSNSIPETNETNNSYSLTFTVYNNGYKGKRYTNGTDLETNQTFEGNYDVIYSGGNSTYRSGGTGGSAWNNPYTVTWTGSDLPIPSSATVVQVRLYQPYTWNTVLGVPDFVANFNGNVLTYLAHYNDTKGYGTSNYPSGLFVYDVTSYFNSAGNTLSLTKGINTTISLYGGYLVVIYQDANATYKKIYINDGADLLCSSNSFSVNDTEATAYANYKSISTANMSNASMVVVLASADKANQSKFFFNGHEYTGFNTAYNSTSQTGFSVYDVFSNMQNGSNLAGIQSYNNGTTGDNMVALSSILIITYDTASPTVNATPIGGLFNTTQTVTLTATDDQDTNPTIYYTTNGTTPTTSSSVYTGPITVNSTTTLKFFAVDETGNTATVQTQVYTIDTTSPAVSASPDGGIFNTTKTVTLQATDNLDTNPVIYFTTDGTTPTISSTQYTAPITVSNTTMLKFFAVDDVGNPSVVQSKTYTIDTVAPEVNADLDNGTFDVVKSVNLSTTDNLDTNPTIYYTIDGSMPTTSSSVYTGPITVDKAMNLKFFAVDDVGNPSPVGSRTYDVKSNVYVEVTASNDAPSVGDTVRYTFKLCNRGPGTATNVVFTYQIPEGMEYAGVSKDSGSVSYDPATRTITWTFSELVAGDPYLWLDLRVLSAGTYLIQPLVTTSNYNPRLTSSIGSLKVNAVVKPASTVLAASKITSSVQADTVPMQTTGLPLGALFAGLLCIVSGLGLHRRF